ncbi:calcium-binding protein [Leptolyngbya cf. ectocarpi LEGE 11479]|uniref:Calcium-binding protein n=1 Tax=Leptolyngbya cf. ectocarpi LEGE 11479 TaxID=1828722 RepID=A0A928X212_LEPEC|nr:calcium-binding protein [Leptolyngbya ectocarpi]MBE9066992.1 calcium-binding protein [Leptolyngbya cf. ectocarpi LEGE 11479]
MANIYGTIYSDNNTFNGFPFIYRRSLRGTNFNDKMYGYGGNDTMYGYSGHDRMYGGTGNDYLDGGFGNDWMYGGYGNDTYIVNSALDKVIEYSFQGVDTVKSAVSYTLGAYLENLTLTGSAYRGNGNSYGNVIKGNNYNNLLYGYGGNDTMYGYGGHDSMYGGLGHDKMYGGTGNDYLSGSFGNDTMYGGLGHDRMYGGSGNDYLDGGFGNDWMYGGYGNDTYVVNSTLDRVIEYSLQGVDTVKSAVSYTLGAYLENLTLTGSAYRGNGNSYSNVIKGNNYNNLLYGYGGNDTMYGYGGHDSMHGGLGHDKMYGGSGNDYLNGGFGNDTMYGGYGNDTYVVNSAFDKVIEYSFQGVDTVQSSISYTLGAYLENLTLIGSAYRGNGNSYSNVIKGNNYNNLLYGYGGNDTMYGYGGHDSMHGGLGHDKMYGGSGNDYLNGGFGNDTMYGGYGNDTYVVNSAFDKVIEYSFQGVDTVQSSISYTLGAYLENLTLTGSAYRGNGNSYSNVIKGNNYNNLLYGYGGNDTMYGYGGKDSMYGGLGHDKMYGGTGNDYLNGGSGNDTLVGGAGSDTLVGGAGNDRLIGVNTAHLRPGKGEIDTLTSGSAFDNDVFVLGANGKVFYDGGPVGSDYAVITDFDKKGFFESSFDKIQLAAGYNYRLGSSANGHDTHIYKDNLFGTDELIGVVKNVQGLHLANSNQFVYS